MKIRTCVSPSGHFKFGIHKPEFSVVNLRENNYITTLGELSNGRLKENHANFPQGRVEEKNAD